VVRDAGQGGALLEEVENYNDLIPGPGELSATLFIEVTEQELLKPTLNSLIGIDRGGTTFLCVGDDEIEAELEGGHSTEVKVSAVHFVRFALTPAQAKGIVPGGPEVALAVRHRDYNARLVLNDDVRASLARDLAEE
jgi:hypothetical protein